MQSVATISSIKIVSDALVEIEAVLPDGKQSLTRHDLDKVLGNHNGHFDFDDRNFSLSAKEIRLDNFTLIASLARIDGTWAEDKVALHVGLSSTNAEQVEVRVSTYGARVALVPNGPSAQRQTVVPGWAILYHDKSVWLCRPNSGTPAVDLNTCIGNNHGEFDMDGVNFTHSAKDIEVIDQSITAGLDDGTGKTNLRACRIVDIIRARVARGDTRFGQLADYLKWQVSPMYRSLELRQGDIRLCRIEAGSWIQPIICSLEVWDGNSTYDCLSYTWGQSNGGWSIVLNGRGFNVTENLFLALRDLRTRGNGKEVLIWIDAICINQEDLAEKNSQVARMSDIYGKAENVVAWIGGQRRLNYHYDTEEAEKQTFEAVVNHLLEGGHLADMPILEYDDSGTIIQKRELQVLFRVLLGISTSPWWTRTWTFQEAVVPEKLVFIRRGMEFQWEDMNRIAHAMNYHHLDCPECSHMSNLVVLNVKFETPIVHFVAKFIYLSVDRSRYRQTLQMAQTDGWRTRSWEKALQTLDQCRERSAFDIRDNLFGVLALLPPNIGSPFAPDYNRGAEHVFRDFTLHVIKEAKSFCIWDYIPLTALSPVKPPSLSLPSWVVDWSIQRGTEISGQMGYGRDVLSFSVVPPFQAPPHLSGDDTLVMEGVEFDKISSITKHSWPTEISAGTMFHEVFSEWSTFAGELGEQPYPGGGDRRDAFWRTTMSDHTSVEEYDGATVFIRSQGNGPEPSGRATSLRRSEPRDFEDWTAWVSALTELAQTLEGGVAGSYRRILRQGDPESPVGLITQSVQLSCFNRKLFRTEKGYLGLAPTMSEPGDVVCLLKGGGKWVYVLRPVSAPGDRGDRAMYSLVGPGYVHGIMDGEAASRLEEAVSIYIC